MKVTITNRVGVRGKTALPGDVLDLSNDEARSLIAWGDAVAYVEAAPEAGTYTGVDGDPEIEPEPEFKTKPGKRRGRPRKNKGDDA